MNRLQKLRLERGETQQQLADYLSLTRKAISFYELGQRDIPNDVLIKLADHFLCTTDYLLGRIPEEQEKWIQEIARKHIDENTPLSERFTSGLLPGLDDPRRDVIEKITNMDEQSMKAVKGIVDVMYSKSVKAGSRDVE